MGKLYLFTSLVRDWTERDGEWEGIGDGERERRAE